MTPDSVDPVGDRRVGMIIENPDDIQLGHWWTVCCHQDLAQIKTVGELEKVRVMKQSQMNDESSGPHPTIYATERAALADIRRGWSEQSMLVEIDERLRKLSFCAHTRVYSGERLLSIPPLWFWVCADCGEVGIESREDSPPLDPEGFTKAMHHFHGVDSYRPPKGRRG